MLLGYENAPVGNSRSGSRFPRSPRQEPGPEERRDFMGKADRDEGGVAGACRGDGFDYGFDIIEVDKLLGHDRATPAEDLVDRHALLQIAQQMLPRWPVGTPTTRTSPRASAPTWCPCA